MPIVPGKPGSVRVRGTIRAQLRKADQVIDSIRTYNSKIGERVPPVVFLTEDESEKLAIAQGICAEWLTKKNT